jgi:hypothetical protein
MKNLLSAFDQTEQFRYESSDCLYRDHRGHRVLADWEGPGTIQLIRSEVSFQLNGLPVRGVLFPYSFDGFATITANEEGTFEAIITRNLRLQSTCNQGFEIFELDSFSASNPSVNISRNWQVQNLSSPVTLDSSFEDGTVHIGYVSSLLSACSFDVKVPADCIGLEVCKTFDQFHGRQCARVWCKGVFKGFWYLPRQDRIHRWAKARFGFELEPSPEESVVRMTMDPPGGTPMWSLGEISVAGLVLK